MVDAAPASDAPRERGSSRDLLLRILLRSGKPPVAISAVISVLFIVSSLALDRTIALLEIAPPVHFPPHIAALSTIVTGLLFGLLLAACAVHHLGTARDLRELAPLLRQGGSDLETLIGDVGCLRTSTRRLVTAVGASVGIAVAAFDPTLQAAYADISAYDPRFVWLIGQNGIMLGLGLRLFATDVHATRAYGRLGEEEVRIDLLDPSGLAPFARKGQRSVVIWTLTSAVLSLYWLLGSAGSVNVLIPVFMLCIVCYAFLRPVLGLRRRIKRAKEQELARVAEAIREARGPLLDGGSPASTQPIADLVAYRSLIAEVREWPFDVPSVLRFLLFAGLGVGSWLGAALVERLLDRLLA